MKIKKHALISKLRGKYSLLQKVIWNSENLAQIKPVECNSIAKRIIHLCLVKIKPKMT